MAELTLVEKYAEGWAKQMVTIWREKIARMRVVHTGALFSSFSETVTHGDIETIALRFLDYGLYQAAGTGNHYDRANGGDLKFLDNDYRVKNRLNRRRKAAPSWGGPYMMSGKPRQQRDWYSVKLFASRMALVEDIGRLTGQQAAAVIVDELSNSHRTYM